MRATQVRPCTTSLSVRARGLGPARRCPATKLHCLPTQVEVASSVGSAGVASTSVTESPVEVRVYNIDRYGLKHLGPTLLKKKIDAIWHVGIAAFGAEYWFDHQINCENLEDVDYAFGFGPTYVYDLGKTKLTKEEFESWLYSVMAQRYSINTYDFEKHNCHHFANELALHLTGNGIPEWCIKHGEDALSELDKSDAERVRWASNKVARIMMVAWGRYNKARFVKKQKERKVDGSEVAGAQAQAQAQAEAGA